MRNILRILKRDIIRLLKSPAALIVVIALCILPSAYTWYNVAGFWNPYENTGNLHVLVVNEDEGYENDLVGEIDAGSMIVERLEGNDQMDWDFADRDSAMESVKAGDAYAVFVIPSDFSEKLISILENPNDRPKIEYYVNEKLGPVSPKITDAGSTELDEQINEAFRSTAAEVALETVGSKIEEVEAASNTATSKAGAKIIETANLLNKVSSSFSDLSVTATKVQSNIKTTQSGLGSVSSSLETAQSKLDSVTKDAESLRESIESIATQSQEKVADAIAALEGFKGVNDDVDAAIDKAVEKLNNFSSGLFKLSDFANTILLKASDATSSLSASVSNIDLIVKEADAVLDQLSTTITAASKAGDETSELLTSLAEDLNSVGADISSLSNSSVISDLAEKYGFDSSSAASFIASPTEIVTVNLYPIQSFGAGMAPLFINLTLWIGAFMLVIIIRQEADDEGIENLKPYQRYLGRFTFLAVIAVIQSAICCTGVIIQGVVPVNAPAFYLATAVASLAYMSIIYALSVLLLHIGKAICILLVFAQIPAATGLYPIELTSQFFQTISPVLPFTYGIKAIREAVCGFYGNDYLVAIIGLLVFLFIPMLLGILLRPLTANVNRMFAKQIKESGILNGDRVEMPAREMPISRLLRLLSGREQFRNDMTARYQRFSLWYPRLIKASVILSIALTVILCSVMIISNTAKTVLLAIWLLAIIIILIAIVVIENMRENIERDLELQDIDDEAFIEIYNKRKDFAMGRVSYNESDDSSDDEDESQAHAPKHIKQRIKEKRRSKKGGDHRA